MHVIYTPPFPEEKERVFYQPELNCRVHPPDWPEDTALMGFGVTTSKLNSHDGVSIEAEQLCPSGYPSATI